MSNEHLELTLDLGEAIRDVIDTYNTGHAIPVATIVGLLHCIAHEIIIDNMEYGLDDDEEM